MTKFYTEEEYNELTDFYSEYNRHNISSLIDDINQKFLFACESGSRTYGFKDNSSDTDLRGVFIDDIDEVLSLNRPKTVLDGSLGDIDYHFDSLSKFLGLLLKSNFNRIEWVHSPYKFVFEDEDKLMEITKGCMTTKMGNHVRGWATKMYNMNWNIPKKCLYAIRPLMVYVHLCETGEFESDITKLVEKETLSKYKTHVNVLINLKTKTKSVPETHKARNRMIYDELRERSDEAEKSIDLPSIVPEEICDLANEYYREVLESEMEE